LEHCEPVIGIRDWQALRCEGGAGCGRRRALPPKVWMCVLTRQPQCILCASEMHTITHTQHPCIALPSPTLGAKVTGQQCARAAPASTCMVCDAVL